jgi:hypothetical protein
MFGGGGGAAAWAAWAAYLLLLAIIHLVLTRLTIHTCRGNIFNTKQGRRLAVLLTAFTANTPAGVLTVAVTLVNAYFSPHVRYLRWFAGILTPQRRNSLATWVSYLQTRADGVHLTGLATSASGPFVTYASRL